jgi:Arc/MetJ-type ribon-helix-helix transcriptional regulator
MKFRKREKQIGVRIRSDQHAALKEIAEREGYESVSEFVRALLEKAIKEQHGKHKS